MMKTRIYPSIISEFVGQKMGALLVLEEKECGVPNGSVFGGNLWFAMPLPFDIR
jgi:hypothetical protein